MQITPLTSMAEAMAERMSGGLTNANITAANGAVGAYFMVDDIVRTPPMNTLVQGAGSNATQAMKNYGMTLAAMAQYAKNAGMPLSSAMVTSLTADASDGVLDGMGYGSRIMMGGGMMGGTMMQPDAGTSGLSDAMADFLASGLNRSGVTSAQMAALMQHLSASDGPMR